MNRYLNSAGQSATAFLLVASGSWATLWPLFGASVQVFAGPSMLTVALWLANWDDTKRVGITGLLIGSGFVLCASTSALLYLGTKNLSTKLLSAAWATQATPAQRLSVLVQVVVALVVVGLAVALVREAYRHFPSRAAAPAGGERVGP